MIVILFYLPSLIGLLFSTWYFFKLAKVANEKQALTTFLFLAMLIIGSGLIFSWLVVLSTAMFFLNLGVPLISWQVLLLPIFWAIVLIPINTMIRK